MTDLETLIEDAKPRYRTMTEMVSATLRKAIIAGTLKSGEPIRQDHLAATFGVSRMPIREALRQLEAEGLVEFFPHRGTVVASIEPADIVETFEIRVLIEGHALRKVVPRMKTSTLDAAEEICEALDNETDMARWGELNRRFHMTLYGELEGSRLYSMIEAQYAPIDRVVRLLLSQLDYMETSQKEHRLILRHCREHDADAAVAVLRDHLTVSSSLLAETLDHRQGDDG